MSCLALRLACWCPPAVHGRLPPPPPRRHTHIHIYTPCPSIAYHGCALGKHHFREHTHRCRHGMHLHPCPHTCSIALSCTHNATTLRPCFPFAHSQHKHTLAVPVLRLTSSRAHPFTATQQSVAPRPLLRPFPHLLHVTATVARVRRATGGSLIPTARSTHGVTSSAACWTLWRESFPSAKMASCWAQHSSCPNSGRGR
jgi:hypothetical protein